MVYTLAPARGATSTGMKMAPGVSPIGSPVLFLNAVTSLENSDASISLTAWMQASNASPEPSASRNLLAQRPQPAAVHSSERIAM